MFAHVLSALLAGVFAFIPPAGSPTYQGRPDIETAAALVYAGGGARVYSAHRAWYAILGVQLLDQEILDLQRRYGKDAVATWLNVSSFAVKDAVRPDGDPAIRLPLPPGPLVGKELMLAVANAGTAGDGAFWTGVWLDKLFSHDVRVRVMHDIDDRYGHAANETFQRVNNRAIFDFDHKVGGAVGLASFH